MPGNAEPTRSRSDLADVVEMLLDKGVVINADIAVSVGDTELLGVEVRAAIASFETAAKYGLEFPAGTDMERVERAANGGPSGDAGDASVDLTDYTADRNSDSRGSSGGGDSGEPVSSGGGDSGKSVPGGGGSSGESVPSGDGDSGESTSDDDAPTHPTQRPNTSSSSGDDDGSN